jgi:hypothetical protein
LGEQIFARSFRTKAAPKTIDLRVIYKIYLTVEFAIIFVGLPLLLRYSPRKIPPLPVLWLASAACLFLLLRDPTFNRAQF